MGKLFGTDGIRGVANQYPITPEIALKVGKAVALFVLENNDEAVIIGKDTRISGSMLESAIASGLSSMGVDVFHAGVIPTPGVACLMKLKNTGAGIVISASHNPYQDNGIKIFKKGGVKLSDKEEEKLEDLILNQEIVPRKNIGNILNISRPLTEYSAFLLEMFPFRKPDKKLRLIIDCSNGASSEIAPMVFNKDLFDAEFIFISPDGININENCGSQHTKALSKKVIETNADAGLAFDGDADRLIVIDETGSQLSGDTIIAICSKYAKDQGELENNTVVTTTMSNIGLTKCLKTLDIKHFMSDVGDRKVLEMMVEENSVIGGEDSGHMIFLNHHTTGDGVLSALKLLEVMLSTNMSLSDLSNIITIYPQVLMNVEVDASRPDFMDVKPIADEIKFVKKELSGQGRVLIRYSGTQPLLRVMVEGPDQLAVDKYCKSICDKIKENI